MTSMGASAFFGSIFLPQLIQIGGRDRGIRNRRKSSYDPSPYSIDFPPTGQIDLNFLCSELYVSKFVSTHFRVVSKVQQLCHSQPPSLRQEPDATTVMQNWNRWHREKRMGRVFALPCESWGYARAAQLTRVSP